MPTLRLYLKVQAMMFVFGIVGPIFLVVFFAAQPDPTLKWMYYSGLVITVADILIALMITDATVRKDRELARQRNQARTDGPG